MAKDFLSEMSARQYGLIASVNRFIRQGAEFEAPSRRSYSDVRQALMDMTEGTASSLAINDGNGWNGDSHMDGGECRVDGVYYHYCETSTSPLHNSEFKPMRSEFQRLMNRYLKATGGNRHTYMASTHVHTAIGYASINGEEALTLRLPAFPMYRNIAMFIARFYPVLKWLSMTNLNGARGANGNQYDPLDGDKIFVWAQTVIANRQGEADIFHHDSRTDGILVNMQRSSVFRIPVPRSYQVPEGGGCNYDLPILNDVFHWENRMMDCNFSPSMMSAWLTLNRAISLWAYDMVGVSHVFLPTSEELQSSQNMAAMHSIGYRTVNKSYIVEQYKLMKSYLAKYFKKINSVDAWNVLDRLIDIPIPAYLESKELGENYDLTELEGHFESQRVRKADSELRSNYLIAIRTMAIPPAGSLNDFHMNAAAHLGIENKQAVSLYQMLKRENVELEFLSGRLFYMGD